MYKKIISCNTTDNINFELVIDDSIQDSVGKVLIKNVLEYNSYQYKIIYSKNKSITFDKTQVFKLFDFKLSKGFINYFFKEFNTVINYKIEEKSTPFVQNSFNCIEDDLEKLFKEDFIKNIFILINALNNFYNNSEILKISESEIKRLNIINSYKSLIKKKLNEENNFLNTRLYFGENYIFFSNQYRFFKNFPEVKLIGILNSIEML